ncbi:serine/arginine-rich splicing factor SC35-like [Camellia sinensis]|uniref:serine/arginine-rich splicing factor SC35-like n=1 Tax=Camellia sinensis TaxID=4442 RepID=UPI00103603CF|nr:serine/arginine-rich splicing factor SC35-like [Camellia sinensis]
MGEGSWIPVIRQRKGGGAHSYGRISTGLVNVFVDNVPLSMDAKALYKIFMKFGVVKDVFIPFKRRRATNSWFGFVRYDCEVAVNIAVQKANGLWIDNRRLQVKITAYDKGKKEEQTRRRT